jgi:hypothetical protein
MKMTYITIFFILFDLFGYSPTQQLSDQLCSHPIQISLKIEHY